MRETNDREKTLAEEHFGGLAPRGPERRSRPNEFLASKVAQDMTAFSIPPFCDRLKKPRDLRCSLRLHLIAFVDSETVCGSFCQSEEVE